MALKHLKRGYQKLERSRQVAFTFFKYRLSPLFFSRLGSAEAPAEAGVETMSVARRFRMALEELGPTFIKFGQMLSMRDDLVPPEFVAELSLLQDSAWFTPPFDIIPVLTKEWGERAEGAFRSFEPTPIAIASLSQIHRAVLKTGEAVAVKIQKPGIEDLITLDLEVLRDVARLWRKRSATGWVYQPELMVEEFSRVIKRELDFLQEAQNYERFRKNFSSDPTVKIPKVYWDLTTSRVLITEFVDGIKITDVIKPEWQGQFDPPLIVRRGVDLMLKQVFEDGFFHADPHPANIFVLPGNVLVMLDVGMVGWLDQKTMRAALKVFHGFTARNPNQIIAALGELGMKKGEADGEALALDLRELFGRYHGLTMQHLNLTDMAADIIAILVRHHMVVPRNMILAVKAFATIETIGRRLDLQFNFFEHARPYMNALMQERFSMMELWDRTKMFLHDASDTLAVLPREVSEAMARLREGRLKFLFEHQGLEPVTRAMDRSARRISFSIIAGFFLVSVALLFRGQDFLAGSDVVGVVAVAGLVMLLCWFVLFTIDSRR